MHWTSIYESTRFVLLFISGMIDSEYAIFLNCIKRIDYYQGILPYETTIRVTISSVNGSVDVTVARS